jgi:amino acid transporter
MVVVDTIGAIAVGGGQAFTWLVVVFVTFFIPSALVCAEMGAALPHEGGACAAYFAQQAIRERHGRRR